MARPDVALVFPPLWYYTSVPADLTHVAGWLRAAGLSVRMIDLSAALPFALFRHLDAFRALRDRRTYEERSRLEVANAALDRAAQDVGRAHGVRYGIRRLRFPDVNEDHVPESAKVALDPNRNPALPLLAGTASALATDAPAVVALALVYPSQRGQVLAMAHLLRAHGYRGFITLYGGLQDEIAPEDFLDDLVGEPLHWLFRDVDGAIVGEPESALVALCRGLEGGDLASVPNLVAPRHLGPEHRPERRIEDLSRTPLPDFTGIDATLYTTPAPVVDLRMGRGCPWGRCGFCAIQAHHPGYRPGRVEAVAEAMTAAYAALGSTFFRIRDDLLTPGQLRQLATVISALSFRPRFSVRMRFEPTLTRDTLALASRAGLEELWLGLESAVPRVRELMDKGVESETVERVLQDAHSLGIRTRALCMIGFPGETTTEARETVQFLTRKLGVLTTASLSEFQLMRRSPMALRPTEFGLSLLPDTLPRYARLRYLQPATWERRIPADDLHALTRDAANTLLPRLRSELLPDAHHGWIAASVARSGWP